jgi:hypothetical protein
MAKLASAQKHYLSLTKSTPTDLPTLKSSIKHLQTLSTHLQALTSQQSQHQSFTTLKSNLQQSHQEPPKIIKQLKEGRLPEGVSCRRMGVGENGVVLVGVEGGCERHAGWVYGVLEGGGAGCVVTMLPPDSPVFIHTDQNYQL